MIASLLNELSNEPPGGSPSGGRLLTKSPSFGDRKRRLEDITQLLSRQISAVLEVVGRSLLMHPALLGAISIAKTCYKRTGYNRPFMRGTSDNLQVPKTFVLFCDIL